MSTHISTALHHRLTLPSWVIAAIVAAVLAVGAIAVFSGSDAATSSPVAAPSVSDLPTTCINSEVVGHC
jgi:hypothetical protein